MNFELLIQLIVNGLIVGLLYGVVAMCFVLVYKSTQIVNFAQGEFLLIGAWVCWASLIYLELPFFAGFLLSLVFMAAFGVLLQMIVLRPRRLEVTGITCMHPTVNNIYIVGFLVI
jgi:branched-chain amino acid transport system permease protein